MRAALFWVITQRVGVIPYRRFGTTCLQGSRIPGPEDGIDSLSETSVRNYQYLLLNNSEERSSQASVCHSSISLMHQF